MTLPDSQSSRSDRPSRRINKLSRRINKPSRQLVCKATARPDGRCSTRRGWQTRQDEDDGRRRGRPDSASAWRWRIRTRQDASGRSVRMIVTDADGLSWRSWRPVLIWYNGSLHKFRVAGEYFAGILTILTHIGALHDRGVILAPKNTKFSYCTLCMYITIPALRLMPNNTGSAPKTPGSKPDGRRLLVFSQGSGGCKLCSKNLLFFLGLLYMKVDKIALKSLRETGPTAALGQPASPICRRRGKATEGDATGPPLRWWNA